MTTPRTFGVLTVEQDKVEFKNFGAVLVEDSPSHHNHPDNPESPNNPRDTARITGYQNPLLGDEGYGKIGRWQTLKLDALENVIDQIIEQYLRDKSWYSEIRCREALWNMYRRVAWWVEQQIDPQKGDYQRTLLMLKDCIRNILDPDKLESVSIHADFEESLDEAFNYTSDWYLDHSTATAKLNAPRTASIRRSHSFPTDGYVRFTFAANLSAGAFVYLNIDGVQVWKYDRTDSGDMSLRDVRYNVPSGNHTLEWGVRNVAGESIARFGEIQIIELRDIDLDNPSTVPHCPAPYYHSYSGDYMNHFDGRHIERPLFDMKSLPVLSDFPPFFRWVSTSEEQEWELVHSTGWNEQFGSENIMKLPLDKLQVGNSSKITLYWRFKEAGYIKFKYLASTTQGNGLLFFVNNNQIGGEWSETGEWQEVTFTVMPGQMYKLDWMVRRRSNLSWGRDAVYIKDVECIETVRTADKPTPPDLDKIGNDAWLDAGYDWITRSNLSVVRTEMGGEHLSEEQRTRKMSLTIHNECDGEVVFSHRLGTDQPIPRFVSTTFYDEEFEGRTQVGISPYESRVQSDNRWNLNSEKAYTTEDNASVSYDVIVGGGDVRKVDLFGTVAIRPAPRELDYYQHIQLANMSDLSFTMSGYNIWQKQGDRLVISNPAQGFGTASTVVNLNEDGYMRFGYSHDMRPSESFEVLVNGISVLRTTGLKSGDNIHVPLKAGSNTITFRLDDLLTEVATNDNFERTFLYGGGRGQKITDTTSLGNAVSMTRNWNVVGGQASSFVDGEQIIYDITLNPGATFHLLENLRFSAPMRGDNSTMVFEDVFNMANQHDPRISFSPNWEWRDLARQFNPSADPSRVHDGVWLVENKNGSVNTVTMSVTTGTHGGFMQFEYGGKFGQYEYLELYDNNKLVWKGNQNTSGFAGTYIKVPLEPGYHTLRWEYRDLGGTTYTPPIEGEPPISSDGGTCFPSGSQTHAVPYNQFSWDTATSRQTRLSHGGDGQPYVSTTRLGHLLQTDGGVVVRDITAPNHTSVNYMEYLDVSAGTGIPVTNLLTVVPPITTGAFQKEGPGDMEGCSTRRVAGRGHVNARRAFLSVIEEAEVSFDYHTYLKEYDAMVGNVTQRYHRGSRGIFSFFVIPATSISDEQLNHFDPTAWTQYRRLEVGENSFTGSVADVKKEFIGRGTSDHFDGMSLNYVPVEGYRRFTSKIVGSGGYYLVWTLLDTCNDLDYSFIGGFYNNFNVFLKNFNYKTHVTQYGTSSDNTQVLVEVVDKTSGSVISSQTYRSGFHGVSTNVPAGGSRQIRYTFIKGTGASGGLLGNGGTALLFLGSFTERWSAYCLDAQGTPYPSPGGGSVTPTPVNVPTDDSWVFLDTIRVFDTTSFPSSSSTVSVRIVDEAGNHVRAHDYRGRTNSAQIDQFLTNSTSRRQTYRMTVTFLRGDVDSGAILTGGKYSITQLGAVPPSQASAWINVVTRMVPVWGGGADGSSISVKVYNEANALVQSRTFSTPGLHNFFVNNLTQSPYSKYRVEITTSQRGTVSPDTGKSYLSTFELLDFKATELWERVPASFNSRLDFYVDGELKETLNEVGGFFEVSHPAPRGQHVYEWVFVGGEGECWDFAEIDWIRVENWVCDKVLITPYCEPGRGDECVEALLKCLTGILKRRPKACVIGKRVWLLT